MGYEFSDGVLVGDVDDAAFESRRIRSGGAAQGIEFLLLAISDNDAGAFSKKGKADRAAKAARATGDQNNFACKTDVHWG